jgi:hypothetical protein
MFQHETMLKSTPMFCWFLVASIVGYWSVIRYLYGPETLYFLGLDLRSVYQNYQIYRLISGPLYPGIFVRNLIINILGVHICSWFVITGYN